MAEEERGVWNKQLEFLLTLIGYAVGLGNVWRFPYLCYKNGGGAFLIPYVICLLFLGIPIFALECAFGQYGGKGPLSIWSINPLFKGLGVTMVIGSFLIFIYYNTVIAIALRYFVASMNSDLPWLDCNICDCLTYGQNLTEEQVKIMAFNNSLNQSCSNLSIFANSTRSPSEIYFTDEILSDTGTIEELGSVRWELLLCNLVAFIIIFLVLVKGIASLGKVVYFTATFPYILLTIILVRVAMLDGAKAGVEFYLQPNWERLGDAEVWSDAATQIFFSISACIGGLIAMSSYNRFDNNIIRDSLMVPIINCMTSFYAGFVVFCTLGYMAHLKGDVPVAEVTAGGPGLVFVVYPEAIGAMPVSTLWAVLFFFTICILGFSTQFSGGETVMTSILDEFPTFFNTQWRQRGLRLGVCLTAFVLGIPMCTEGGQHLLELVDAAVLGFPLLLIGLFEYIVLIYIYGYTKFAEDIEAMVGFKPFLYFKVTWCVISPLLLLAVTAFKAYGMNDFDPAWKGLLYYLIVIFLIMWIPLGFFYYGRNEIAMAMSPLPYWEQRREKSGKTETQTETDSMELNPVTSISGGYVMYSGSTKLKGDETKKHLTDPPAYSDVGRVNKGYLASNEQIDVKM